MQGLSSEQQTIKSEVERDAASSKLISDAIVYIIALAFIFTIIPYFDVGVFDYYSQLKDFYFMPWVIFACMIACYGIFVIIFLRGSDKRLRLRIESAYKKVTCDECGNPFALKIWTKEKILHSIPRQSISNGGSGRMSSGSVSGDPARNFVDEIHKSWTEQTIEEITHKKCVICESHKTYSRQFTRKRDVQSSTIRRWS